MSLTLKLTSLGIRTIAKPIGNLIKRQAREHEGFRRFCVRFAQGLHQLDARMRLGLLEDSEAITRQIEKEAANAEAKRLRSQHRPSSKTPTVKTKEQAEADEQAKEKERKFIEEKVKNDEKKKERQLLKPLPTSKAIETGANFASEAFVFIVAVGLLLFENFRSRRKATDRREDVDDRLERLEGEVKRAQEAEGQLEDRVGSLLAEIKRLKETDNVDGQQGSSATAHVQTNKEKPGQAKPVALDGKSKAPSKNEKSNENSTQANSS